MINYNLLKQRYIAIIHFFLPLQIPYEEMKRGNDLLHKAFENLIDSANNCSDYDKNNMKQEIQLVKETLSKEIDLYYAK